MGVTTSCLLVVYPWRPGLGDGSQLRQLVPHLSPTLFLAGQLYSASRLEGGEPSEE